MATAATERSSSDGVRLATTTSMVVKKAKNSSPKVLVQKSKTNDETDVFLPLRRRRSSRGTNRILMSASRNGSLQYRRLEELFFQEQGEEDEEEPPRRRPKRKASSLSEPPPPPVLLRMDKFSLERVHQSPNIYVIENFLSPNDLEYLQQSIASRKFQASYCDDPDSAESVLDDTHRTSTFLSFVKQENAKVAAIEQKAARLLGCYSTDSIEPLQLVRYRPGQFFGVHHDMGDYDPDSGRVALPPKSVLVKRRLVTIFCYLNDLPPKAGGCTGFPACDNLRVRPKAGRAVVFCNVTAEGLPDPRTIHAGEVVVEKKIKEKKKVKKEKKKAKEKKKDAATGDAAPDSPTKKKKPKPRVKYGLNIWVCES